MPFVASPTFNTLYKYTVRTFPAAFIFVVIGFKTLVFVDVLIVHIKSRKVQKKKKQLELEASQKLKASEEQKQKFETKPTASQDASATLLS